MSLTVVIPEFVEMMVINLALLHAGAIASVIQAMFATHSQAPTMIPVVHVFPKPNVKLRSAQKENNGISVDSNVTKPSVVQMVRLVARQLKCAQIIVNQDVNVFQVLCEIKMESV